MNMITRFDYNNKLREEILEEKRQARLLKKELLEKERKTESSKEN